MSNEIESNRLPRRDGIRWLVEERASQDDDVSLIQLLRVEITNTFWAFQPTFHECLVNWCFAVKTNKTEKPSQLHSLGKWRTI